MSSPLLFPVRLENNKIIVLDETALPFKEDYIQVSSLEEALRVLGQMKTRSLGQVLLFFYSCVLFKDEFKIDLISEKFKEKRPTFDFYMLGSILKEQVKKGIAVDMAVDKFIKGFDALRKNRAKRLAKILPTSCNIATICNLNGELIYVYEELIKLGKKAFFYICETRPYLQGTRLTFWELRRNNIPCKIICDSQIAYLMREGLINSVIAGADRATTRGDIINKIGTYALGCLSKYFNIPFYALIQYPRDIDIERIEIEEREKEEVFMYLDGDFSQIEAVYPSFDITKHQLITKSIEIGAGSEVKCA